MYLDTPVPNSGNTEVDIVSRVMSLRATFAIVLTLGPCTSFVV
jgi:hypothetical protein